MSIRVRLLLLILGAILLPAMLLGWRYLEDRARGVDATIDEMAATARVIATGIDAKIQGTTQLHFGLARAEDLRRPDKAACSKFLADVLEKNPDFTGILTINTDGSLFCDSLRTGRTLDLRDRSYFQRALGRPGTAVIEPVYGRLTGSAVLQIAYAAPDERGLAKFVLLASLDLKRLLQEQIRNLPSGYQFQLVDDKGNVFVQISAPSPTADAAASIAETERFRLASQGSQGTMELTSEREGREVWAFAKTLPVGGVQMQVMIGSAKDAIVAQAERRLAEDMVILAIVSMLMLASVGLFAEIGIRSQIGRIANMVRSLGDGDLAARIAPPFPGGELGSLMKVLNQTASSLELHRRDIEQLNQRLRKSQELEAVERQLLDVALNNMAHGLVMYDASERVVTFNRQMTEMLGLSPLAITPGVTFRDAIAHCNATGTLSVDVEDYRAAFMRNLAKGDAATVLSTPGGRFIRVLARAIKGGGWVMTGEDVTERKRFDTKISHMAHYDALTDLPNRLLFREQLEARLNGLSPGSEIAVLYIDIDEFKRINDSLGHPVGDELLQAVASRLSSCVAADDLVARLGGDEFAIIRAHAEREADTMDLITRIYQAIREPYECSGHMLTTDASIGVALAPRDGSDLDQLLKNADLAMYEAKADGRRTYRFFEPGMGARVHALRTLELDLRQAIADGAFDIYYQPVVNVRDERIVGCEALVRWNHPVRGMIAPSDFIPVAEETGLIGPLGEWVLTRACKEAASWPGDIRLAVNVSPVQFRSQAFTLKVAMALAASGLPASKLELEITEAVLIRDDAAALAMLHSLRALGVRIALDDFGTGYSSLSYLQRFPFDKIKIDRCFVKDITEPDGSGSIVQAVVNIAAARQIATTAEGVETREQFEALRDVECTEIQGYLFSPPVSAAEIRKLLRADESKVAGAA